MMLDDLNYIAQIDADNALAVVAGQSEQLLYSDFKFKPPKLGEINNIVLIGMGGSALAGLLFKNAFDISVPFEVVRDYQAPAYINKKTLVIASSYSGNTEETVHAVKDAAHRGAKIIAITSGGELAEGAEKHKRTVLKLPEGYQPRMAVFFTLRILAVIFEGLGFVKNTVKEVEAAAENLKKQAGLLVPQVETSQNQAKQIADEVLGKTAIIYSGPVLAAAAYKWKTDFNENAKNLAWCNQLPELNHNEFVGWTSHPVEKPFCVIELHSNLDHPQIGRRFDVTNRLLSGQMPSPIEVEAEGTTKIEQILWAVQLGDFASIYLAVLNGVNPTPVDAIEKLKKEL